MQRSIVAISALLLLATPAAAQLPRAATRELDSLLDAPPFNRTLWGVAVVGSADNFIKPMVIGRNSNLPFVLIFLGILGGVIQFGALGIFLGPTLLAMGFALSKEWLMGIEQKNTKPNLNAEAVEP